MKMTAKIPTSDILTIIVLTLLPAGGFRAGTPEEAEHFFAEQSYEKALEIWYQQAESGQANAGVYYNIGVAESLSNNIPKSILAFEQALRLKPMHATIRRTLVEERKKIENNTTPVQPFILFDWYRGFIMLMRPGVWALFGSGLILIAVVHYLGRLHILPIWQHTRKKLEPLFIAAGGVCFVIAGLGYHHLYRTDEAILHTRCEFKQAASMESPVIRNLFPGEKVVIQDQIGEWYHVHLVNMDAGWVKGDCMMTIQMHKP